MEIAEGTQAEGRSGREGAALRIAARLAAATILALPLSADAGLLPVLVLAALVVGVACVGDELARRWLGEDIASHDRWLAAAVLALATWVVTAVVLGHFGALTPFAFRTAIALLVAASAVAIWIPARRQVPDSSEVVGEGETAEHAGAGKPHLRLVRGSSVDELRSERLATVLAIGILAAAAAGLLLAARDARFEPPGRYSFDDTSYHLTTVATWAAHGDLRMPRFSFGDPSTPFYPFASELVSWGLTVPWLGGDFLARWAELPFAALTLLAVWALARNLGARPAVAALAPLLYLTVREGFPDLALSAGSDHALAFACVASAHAARLCGRRSGAGSGAYLGACLGLVVGSKLIGLLYAPWLALLAALELLAGRPAAGATAPGGTVAAQRADARRWLSAVLRGLAAAAVVALLVGGYSYLRNALVAGNPFFPVPLELGPLRLPGWVESTLAYRRQAPEFAIDPRAMLVARTDLLGPLCRWTLLPAALLAPLVALVGRREASPGRRWAGRFAAALLLALPVLFFLAYLELMHDHRKLRYVFAALALAAVATAWLVGRLPPSWGRWLAVAVGLLALATWLDHATAGRTWAALAGLVAGVAAAAAPRFRRSWPIGGLPLAILVLAALVGSTVAKAEAGYRRARLAGDRAAHAFAEMTASSGAVRIAYVGWNQPYLFSGDRLQNIVYIPPAGPLQGMLWTWGAPPDDPYLMHRREAWLRNVRRLGIEYVVWVAAGEQDLERRWMEALPGRFQRVWGDGAVEIWRVLEAGAGAGAPGPADR